MPTPTLDDPTTFAKTIRRRSETVWLPVYKDNSGTPYMDSAKQPLLKPIFEPYACLRVEGTWVIDSTASDAFCTTWLDKVNSGLWRGFGAGQAWISEIVTDPADINSSTTEIIRVTVRCLQGRKWNSIFPDMGYVYESGGNLFPFKSNGSRFIGKLDGSGGVLAVASDLVLNEWDYKTTANFASLGF